MPLPNVRQRITTDQSIVTVPWYRFFQELQEAENQGSEIINSVVEIEGVNCPVNAGLGDAVYITGSNTVGRANASNTATSKVIGLISDKTTATTCKVRLNGLLEVYSSLVPTSTYYLGETDGQITTSLPSNPSSVVVEIGQALKNTSLTINIDEKEQISSELIYESFIPNNGQTIFTLSSILSATQIINSRVFVNGQKLQNITCYTISGTQLTIILPYDLATTDNLEIYY